MNTPEMISGMNSDSYNFFVLADQDKRDWAAASYIHQNYYAGRQQYALDQFNGTVLFDDRVRFCANVSAGAIDITHATLTENEMELEGNPFPSGEKSDQFAAECATAVFRDHEKRNRSRAVRDAMMRQLLITGTEFIRVGFDPDVPAYLVMSAEEAAMFEQMATETRRQKGDNRPFKPLAPPVPLADGLFRFLYPIGGTTEQWVTSSLVFVRGGGFGSVVDWRNVEEFIVVSYPTVRSLRNEYEGLVDPDIIKPMPIQNVRGANNFTSIGTAWNSASRYNSNMGDRFDASRDMTWRVEHWAKAGDTWDCKVMTGELMKETLAEYRGIPTNQYVRFDCNPTGRLWSKGLYWDMRQPQFAANISFSLALGYLEKGIKDHILLPFGATTSPITNDHNLIIEFDPAQGPPQIQAASYQTVQIYREVANEFLGMVMRLGKVSEVARGATTQRLAGTAIQELQQQWATPIGQMRRNNKDAFEEVGRVILTIAQQEYGMDRLGALMGIYGDVAAQAFKGSDVLSGTDVRVQEVQTTERSREQRQDFALQLVKMGASPDVVSEYINSGSLTPPIPQNVREAERQAEYEFQAIKEGRVTLAPPTATIQYLQPDSPLYFQSRLAYTDPVEGGAVYEPLFDPLQLHEVHLAEHMKHLNDKTLSVMQRQLLRYHIEAETQSFLSIQAQAQQQQELEYRAQLAKADQAGTMQTTITSQILADAADKDKEGAPKPKGSPASGGRNSGRTRSRNAA